MTNISTRSFIALILSLSTITIYRIYFIYLGKYDLFADEAQYWVWAKNLDFGYYSKPPMVAWLIALTTSMLNDSSFAIRLGSPILHLLISFVIYAISNRLYNQKTAALASLTYITLPAVTLSSSLISTDPLLMLFWSIAIYFLIDCLEKNSAISWFLLAMAFGLGCLSKYNMVIFIPSVLLYVIWSEKYSLSNLFCNRLFYFAAIIAAFIYLPNLVWNYQHSFVSYSHTKEIARLDQELFHFKQLAEFLATQLLIIGPGLAYLLIASIGRIKTLIIEENSKLLISLTLPFLVIIGGLSFIANAFANWAAPIFITIIIWIASYSVKNKRIKLLSFSIILNLLIAVIFYNYHSFTKLLIQLNIGTVKFYAQKDPFARLTGWSELGDQVKQLHKQFPHAIIVSEERKTLAELSYYVDLNDIKIWNSTDKISNYFDMKRNLNNDVGRDLLMVTSQVSLDAVKKYFDSVKELTPITIKINDYKTKFYRIYYLQNFKGYY